jgi:hypothetical protein
MSAPSSLSVMPGRILRLLDSDLAFALAAAAAKALVWSPSGPKPRSLAGTHWSARRRNSGSSGSVLVHASRHLEGLPTCATSNAACHFLVEPFALSASTHQAPQRSTRSRWPGCRASHDRPCKRSSPAEPREQHSAPSSQAAPPRRQTPPSTGPESASSTRRHRASAGLSIPAHQLHEAPLAPGLAPRVADDPVLHLLAVNLLNTPADHADHVVDLGRGRGQWSSQVDCCTTAAPVRFPSRKGWRARGPFGAWAGCMGRSTPRSTPMQLLYGPPEDSPCARRRAHPRTHPCCPAATRAPMRERPSGWRSEPLSAPDANPERPLRHGCARGSRHTRLTVASMPQEIGPRW